MQGTSQKPELESHHAFLHQDTDTASPSTPVPIFCIHGFEQPFCTRENCDCQRQPQAVRRLFIQIIEGKLELERAAVFLDEINGEGK
jgi:hypothetical protein